MALFEDKCYGCICDGCKDHYESSVFGYTIFGDEQQLREGLSEDGWQEIDGKWYCPHCHTYNEEKEEYVPIWRKGE